LKYNADPTVEILKRIRQAQYLRLRTMTIWRSSSLNERQKLQRFRTLILSGLLYAIHILPLKDSDLEKLDAFFFTGLRSILNMVSTFIDRANSNEVVLRKANELLAGSLARGGKPRKASPLIAPSSLMKLRSIKMLGNIFRSDEMDPRKRVLFLPNSFCRQRPVRRRDGRPRISWIVRTLEWAWVTQVVQQDRIPPHLRIFGGEVELEQISLLADLARDLEF
jgi:hypothetical protein